jgi:hypothetical protein
VVNLPAAAAGQNVQLRWRCGTGSPPTSSGTLAYWSFDGSSSAATTVGAGISAVPFTVSNVGGSLTYYAGNPGTGQAIASSGFTTSAGPPTASYSYFAFAITPANGLQVSLSSISFDDRASGTGPKSFNVQVSQQSDFSTLIYDSGIKSTHAAFTSTPMNSLALTNAGLTGTIYFRIYAYAASGSAGTWRLDNFNIQGTMAGAAAGSGWVIDSVSIKDTVCCTNPVINPPVAVFTASPTNGCDLHGQL